MKKQSLKKLISTILACISAVNVLSELEKQIILRKIADGMTYEEAVKLLELLEKSLAIQATQGTHE